MKLMLAEILVRCACAHQHFFLRCYYWCCLSLVSQLIAFNWLHGHTLFHMILNNACELGRLQIPHSRLVFIMCRWSLIGSDFFSVLPLQLVRNHIQSASSKTVRVQYMCTSDATSIHCVCGFSLCLSHEKHFFFLLKARIWFRYLFIWCLFDDVQKFILKSFYFRSFFVSFLSWYRLLRLPISDKSSSEKDRERMPRCEAKCTVQWNWWEIMNEINLHRIHIEDDFF